MKQTSLMMITLITAQFVCYLPFTNFLWVFSCNYKNKSVIGRHGELLRQTWQDMIVEWLIDSRNLKVALIMCPPLTFDSSLCSLTTQTVEAEQGRLAALLPLLTDCLVFLPPPQFTQTSTILHSRCVLTHQSEFMWTENCGRSFEILYFGSGNA